MNQTVGTSARDRQPESLTHHLTTKSGLAWRIELEAALAIGETLRGRVFFEGEHEHGVTAGSVALIARTSQTSTGLDIGELVGGAIDRSGAEDGDAIPLHTSTKTATGVRLATPLALALGADAGQEVGAFELPIPLDAPARIRTRAFVIEWTLRVELQREQGLVALALTDIPVSLPRTAIAQTPYLEPEATETIVRGGKDGTEWSIQVEEMPLTPGGMCRGTLVVTATDRTRTARADVRIDGRIGPKGQVTAPVDWTAPGKVVEDRLDEEGRRRVVFEAQIPPDAFVTTGVGNTRLVATLWIGLLRWRWFGPLFQRPVAIASAPDDSRTAAIDGPAARPA